MERTAVMTVVARPWASVDTMDDVIVPTLVEEVVDVECNVTSVDI